MSENKKVYTTIFKGELEELISKSKKLPFFELRLDLSNLNFNEFKLFLEYRKDFILTIRECARFSDFERLTIYKYAVDNSIEYIDIDTNDKSFIDDLNLNHTKLILSFHDFNKTPDIETLNNYINMAKKYNADYIKISTLIKSKNDIDRLLLLKKNHNNVIFVPMGDDCAFLRAELLSKGVEFTYGAHSEDEKANVNIPTVVDILKFI